MGTMMRMTWKKVMLHLPRKKKMILHLHLVKMKLKMKMIHLHLVKIVDEKERVAKVENLASLENLENPVNPSLLQKDLKTLHFQIIRFLFKLNYFCERYLKTIKEV